MKIHGSIRINRRRYEPGDEVPAGRVYPAFLIHITVFGLFGCAVAYDADGPGWLFFVVQGIAALVYLRFYFALFGVDEVRWMVTNAALGLLGIYAQLDLILSAFGKRAADYPASAHVVPVIYYVLYTFLLRQLVLDLTGARDRPTRRRVVEAAYVVASVAIYAALLFWNP